MTDDETQTQNAMLTISKLVGDGKYTEALKSIDNFENTNPNNAALKYNKPGFLIDIGFGLKDEALVQTGIQLGENNLKDNQYKRYRTSIYYNLANGYLSLYGLVERSRGLKIIPQSDNLQKAKKYLRTVTTDQHLNRDLLIQAWVNLANCFDSLGRGIEAIGAYSNALRMQKDFSMALGNRAIAFRAFADISGKYQIPIYVEAYQTIESILSKPDLIEVGGLTAKQYFENELKLIESRLPDKSVVNKKIKHPKYKTKNLSSFERCYIDFCINHKLFLNFHIHDDHCEAAIEDPVFIRLVTKIDDNDTFYNLAKQLNQIKEDYAVARLNLVQSQYKQKDFDNISKRTSYVYALDYSQFNLYVGLLKSAFKDAFNILDKIAVFINDYYELGYSEERISFDYIKGEARGTSIWEENSIIRQKLLDSKNMSLYALYDIQQDFKSRHYGRIQEIRNALTHRRLIVFSSSIASSDNNADKHNIDSDTFLQETIGLMRLTKAAIIYLINFVNTEEEKKHKISDKPILSMHTDTSQFL